MTLSHFLTHTRVNHDSRVNAIAVSRLKLTRYLVCNQFAEAGHFTLVVSTDPAHSLSDSLAQHVGGGAPVEVEGTDGFLWGMEIDPEASKAEFAAFTAKDGGKGVKDFMGSMGMGGILSQLEDLKLGELLETPPPGLDEAIAITKVVDFIRDEKV